MFRIEMVRLIWFNNFFMWEAVGKNSTHGSHFGPGLQCQNKEIICMQYNNRKDFAGTHDIWEKIYIYVNLTKLGAQKGEIGDRRIT